MNIISESFTYYLFGQKPLWIRMKITLKESNLKILFLS
jgi:hypothetical protein